MFFAGESRNAQSVCVCVCVCVAQYTFLPFQGFGVGKILKEVFYDGYKTTVIWF